LPLRFDSDITNCAVVATQNGSPDMLTVRVEKAGTEAMVYIRNTTDEELDRFLDSRDLLAMAVHAIDGLR
jgi:hypothetical protein